MCRYVGHPILAKWVSLFNNATNATNATKVRQSFAVPGTALLAEPCDGSSGCSTCPGAVTMEACQGAAVQQHWQWHPGNMTLTSQGQCLTAAGADATHAGCPRLVPCVAAAALQRWNLTVIANNVGFLQSLDASTCDSPSPPGCCATVTANRQDAGAWWNMGPCRADWEEQFALVGQHLVDATSMLCASASSGAAPPTPPLPPPPPPPGVATLSQILVETLAVNQPYSPLGFYSYPKGSVM